MSEKPKKSGRKWGITLQSSNYIEIKQYYSEYVEYCQQTLHPVPSFHLFCTEMMKIGFNAWRTKNKRA